MKKFLSIFIAVAMVLSFSAMFTAAPVAKAATPTTVTITDATSTLNYYNPVPAFGTAGTENSLDSQLVYKMGDTIHGYLDVAPDDPWQVQLVKTDGTIVDTVDVAAGGTSFTIGTGNVDKDGEYYLVIHSPSGEFTDLDSQHFFIEYNLTWGSKTLTTCDSSQTISGWITRGNGQTVLVPVSVYVAYPNDELAGYYTVTPSSSGQFTITFPITPGDPTYIGDYNIFIRDGYDPANTDNDAIVYDTLSNVPATSLTLSTYVSPAILYKNMSNQPFLLVLKDQDGNYVDGATITASYNVTGTPGLTVTEISKGFYRLVVDTTTAPSAQDIRFKATKTLYGNTVTSNLVIVNLRDKGVFNPYIDVNAIHSISPYGDGPTKCTDSLARDVYDKLPCTIGNALEIKVGVYGVADSANWYLYDVSTSVNGPVTSLGNDRYLVEKAGKITASVSVTAWQRANTDCPTWNGLATKQEMAENACCHTYSKTFSLCEVQSCTVDKISLENDAQTDDTTIEVGKSADLVLSIGSQSAPADLECGCNSKIVHIYMTNGCDVLSNAFTVKTFAGSTKTVNEIWWNPVGAADTNIPELPITFGQTDTELMIHDNCSTLTISGFTPNYTNTTSCGYHLVIQVFGQKRTYDSCGNLTLTYPLIYEGVDDLSFVPETKELSSKYTITEGSSDPDEILAGVYPIIDITDPGFSLGTPSWSLTLNGNAVSGSVSPTDTGYRVTLNCPLSTSGTFEIYGSVTDSTCTKKEEVKIDIPVVKPEFTVQIGLADGSTIDNDGIITEGIPELIYVTATDPRGIHDFSTDPNWTLKAGAFFNGYSNLIDYGKFYDGVGNFDDCGIPSSIVCYSVPSGCTEPSPIKVTGFANPNSKEDPTFDVYFVSHDCAYIDVGTFKLVPPTVKVDPDTVPFTIPATATHVTFTVTDAHGHGAPGVEVTLGTSGVSAGAEGYGWSATVGTTGPSGEVDWAFVPPYSGEYTVGTQFTTECTLPCGWSTPSGLAKIVAKYQAPAKDTEAPTLTISAPEDGATVDTDTVEVKGTVTDNVGVTSLYVGTQKVSFAPDGSFSATVQLAEGKNTIKVFAFDAAGNKAEKDLTVTYAPLKKTVITVQIGSDVMTVNGQVQQLDVAPVIHEGHTYLPLRAIAEALGAKVDWIAATKGITLTLGKHTVGLQIGNVSAVVDGNVVAIFPPYLQPYGDGTYAATMVPLRVIAEGLGAEVTWDPATRVVTITLVQQP